MLVGLETTTFASHRHYDNGQDMLNSVSYQYIKYYLILKSGRLAWRVRVPHIADYVEIVLVWERPPPRDRKC